MFVKSQSFSQTYILVLWSSLYQCCYHYVLTIWVAGKQRAHITRATRESLVFCFLCFKKCMINAPIIGSLCKITFYPYYKHTYNAPNSHLKACLEGSYPGQWKSVHSIFILRSPVSKQVKLPVRRYQKAVNSHITIHPTGYPFTSRSICDRDYVMTIILV